jgi:hypothetical protein
LLFLVENSVSMSDNSYATSGNALQGASVASVLAYTVLVVLFAKPGSQIFDEQWVEDGFCVINKDIPYWSTHDLCLYCDILLVIVGWGIYERLRDSGPEMKSMDDLMRFNLLGHLGHGAAHGFIAYQLYRAPGSHEQIQGTSNTLEKFLQMDMMLLVPGIWLFLAFWFGLLKGAMPKASNKTIAVLTVLVSTGQLFVKEIFAFGYVQAILAVAFTCTQLRLPAKDKNFSYFANSTTSLAISLVPWVECLACQSVASKLGGHLIFDVSIPIFLGGSYVASWLHCDQKKRRTGKQA